MNKKLLFTFPLAVSCLALFSCGGETVTKISATVPSTNVYKRDGTISKDDITVTADTNNGSKKIASKDWTSDKFGSNTTYTFTASGENTIDIKYGGQSCDVKVSVNPKGSTDFTFKDGGSIKLGLEETKTVEITMNETGAEVDIAKVDWSIGELSPEKDAIKITPDTTNKFKCTVEGLKVGEAIVNASATDTVGNSKQHTLNVSVEDTTPAWQKYCQFDINGENTVQVSVKNNIVRSTVVGALELPSKVDGKFVISGTEGTEYTVNKVANQGFQSCTALTSINIPSSVIEIDYEAFTGCSSLSTVTLNEGLERIQGNAFSHAKVTDFVIPSTVIELNGGALGHNDKLLTSLTFADKSTRWLIQPDKGSFLDIYSPDDDVLLTKFNQNITTYWEKCVVEITKPGEVVQFGRSGTVAIAEGTLGEAYSCDETVLTITGTAPNFTYTAQQKQDRVDIIVVTDDFKYGFATILVVENP